MRRTHGRRGDAPWQPVPAGGRLADRAGIAAPDGAVREALDTAWWRRLADADGEFLVAVLGHRIGGNDSWWTRVRYAGGGVPGLTGDPGFVALSLDGQVLLAEVPGADGPRVTALDRLPERLEEAAAAAGRETEVERAEVWAAVPGQPAWPLHWAEGIGSNPAAPDELLIRLLDVAEGFLHGCDRPAVLDAAVAHPDPRVRSTPADTFRPKLTSDQWIRLVRAEPSPSRRVLWAEHACAWGSNSPGTCTTTSSPPVPRSGRRTPGAPRTPPPQPHGRRRSRGAGDCLRPVGRPRRAAAGATARRHRRRGANGGAARPPHQRPHASRGLHRAAHAPARARTVPSRTRVGGGSGPGRGRGGTPSAGHQPAAQCTQRRRPGAGPIRRHPLGGGTAARPQRGAACRGALRLRPDVDVAHCALGRGPAR